MKSVPRLLLALALAAGIALALVYRDHLDAAALTDWVAAAGLAGPLVFMAVYALATVLFLPGSLLTLAGGAAIGDPGRRDRCWAPGHTPRHTLAGGPDNPAGSWRP